MRLECLEKCRFGIPKKKIEKANVGAAMSITLLKQFVRASAHQRNDDEDEEKMKIRKYDVLFGIREERKKN